MSTAAAATATALKVLTTEQLWDMFGDADEATQLLILADVKRREKVAAHKAYRHAMYAEWRDGFEADFAAAEAATVGYWFSEAGRAAGINPERLWTGTEEWAMAMASEELKNFWETRPRVTVWQYKRQVWAANAAAREAAREAKRLGLAA